MPTAKTKTPKPATLVPPGAVTGHAHPRCFASVDNNCSNRISREHFISETLLRQIELNNTAKIAGLRWQPPQSFNILPLKGLASNILCERHNSALSPLDAAVGAFTLAIGAIDGELHPKSTSARFVRYEFCGEDIERWMLKCLIGMVVSGNLGGVLKSECHDLLFDRVPWPTGWGLYWLHDKGGTAYHSQSFAISTDVHPQTGVIVLVRFTLRGMPFALCLGRPDHPTQFGVLRPKSLTFKTSERTRTVVLNWSRSRSGYPIILNRAGSYDGPPPNWQEWERES